MSTHIDTLRALRRGDLAGARELSLPAGLTELPSEVLGLADSLEVLEIGPGGLTDLPKGFSDLRRLRVIFCSRNRFNRLPAVLGNCENLVQIGCRESGIREVPGEALPAQLRWLTLTGNRIEMLPGELGHRKELQKLMLAGNRLTELPPTLAHAPNLELIRLAANRLDRLPDWLTHLPHLAWIAYGGNPCEPTPSKTSIVSVPWASLRPGVQLGEGSSGRVVEATWLREGGGATVALKLFKAAMTSDGLPESEMAACFEAGDHPNLLGGLGRIVGHPDNVSGLLMPLLPRDWRALASPPSRASCSRDVYDEHLRLTIDTAIRLARSAAAATAHLHERGLIHGDVYAHNLLWDGSTGAAVLSDMGAASHFSRSPRGEALQRIEVRAWGILLGECLDRCAEQVDQRLRALQGACIFPDPKMRPSMTEALDVLDQIHPLRTSGSKNLVPPTPPIWHGRFD